MKLNTWIALNVGVIILGFLVLNNLNREQKLYEFENDLRITKTAEFAYFTGCTEISRDYTYCKVKAEIYARELREAVLSGKGL